MNITETYHPAQKVSSSFIHPPTYRNTIRILNTNHSPTRKSIKKHTNPTHPVAFNPTKDLLASDSKVNGDDSLEYAVQINGKSCDFVASEQNDTANNHTILSLTLPQNVHSKAFQLNITAKNRAGETSQERTLFYASEKQKPAPTPTRIIQQPTRIIKPQQRRLALIIGNNDYSGTAKLYNPVNDARSMADALKALDFQVYDYYNLNKEGMAEALEDFEDKLHQGDVALFFFAGHGLEVKGKNYLIPTQREFKTELNIRHHAFAVPKLLESMESGGSALNIVILDACRTNPFRALRANHGGLATVNFPNRHLEIAPYNNYHAQGTLIAFATSPKETALDGHKAEGNSPYTTALLKHLKTQNLEIETLFKRVRQEVMVSTHGSQRPWNNTDMFGDFYFNPQE